VEENIIYRNFACSYENTYGTNSKLKAASEYLSAMSLVGLLQCSSLTGKRKNPPKNEVIFTVTSWFLNAAIKLFEESS
jgi:hypothetical protein